MRIGLYGGTFDPIHFGHLAVADEVRRALPLDRVLFVPAAQSPLRPAPRAAGQHRLRMCQLAIAGRPEFAVSEVDLERAPPSYTVDTIRALHAAHPGDDLSLIVGADTLGDLAAWRDVAGILALVRLVAVTRPGYPNEPPPALIAADPSAAARIQFHAMPPIDISASTVRDLAARGQPLEAYVLPEVRDYIRKHRLYHV